MQQTSQNHATSPAARRPPPAARRPQLAQRKGEVFPLQLMARTIRNGKCGMGNVNSEALPLFQIPHFTFHISHSCPGHASSLRSAWWRCFRSNSCCQMRTTFHPFFRRSRFCFRSRFLFPSIFASHHSRRVAGIFARVGCPCQKSPSTNTAIFHAVKTKSGRTKNEEPRNRNFLLRLHPVIPWPRKTRIIANSVALFPVERISDITSDRLDFVKTSGIGGRATVGGDLETAPGFVLLALDHPVVEPGPLRVAGVKLFV